MADEKQTASVDGEKGKVVYKGRYVVVVDRGHAFQAVAGVLN